MSAALPALVTVISVKDRLTLTLKSVGMNCTLYWDWFRDEYGPLLVVIIIVVSPVDPRSGWALMETTFESDTALYCNC